MDKNAWITGRAPGFSTGRTWFPWFSANLDHLQLPLLRLLLLGVLLGDSRYGVARLGLEVLRPPGTNARTRQTQTDLSGAELCLEPGHLPDERAGLALRVEHRLLLRQLRLTAQNYLEADLLREKHEHLAGQHLRPSPETCDDVLDVVLDQAVDGLVPG